MKRELGLRTIFSSRKSYLNVISARFKPVSCDLLLSAHNFNRTFGALRDGGRNTAEQEAVNGIQASGADENRGRPPIFGLLNDLAARVAFAYSIRNQQSGF